MKSSLNKIAKISASVALAFGVAHSANATDESFQASMKLLAPIVITETQALSFADTISGQTTNVTTAAADASAALFTATGEANRAVTGSIVESSINMTTGAGVTTPEQIVVDTFSTGGDMDGAGSATFDATGNLNDLRIGGVAHVEAEDVAGQYTGTATFRVVYN